MRVTARPLLPLNTHSGENSRAEQSGAESMASSNWSASTPNPQNTQAALDERQRKAMRQDAGAAARRGKRSI